MGFGAAAAGLGAAALLVAVASLDLGDPASAARARAARQAEAELALFEREVEQRLTTAAPPAPIAGVAVRVPRAAVGSPPAPSGPSDSELWTSDSGELVLRALTTAARAAAVDGRRAEALALLSDALASAPEGASTAKAEAHLRGLAWAAAEGDDAAARVHRAALATSDLHRAGIPYALLCVLTGAPDAALAQDVLARFAAGALRLRDTPQDRVSLHPERGLVVELDAKREVLGEALAQRYPELDLGAAFERDSRLAYALGPVFGALDGPATERWELAAAGPHVLGEFHTADTVHCAVFELDALCRALSELQRASTDITVTVQPEGTALASELLAPRPLGFAGLVATAAAPSLAAEIAREAQRIALLRGGLLLAAALVALAGLFAARNVRREARLAQLRSTFVASVSHDLRTPLASLSLLIDNLEQGRIATESARGRYYGALRQESERLRRMVEDLLDASRVERGRGPRVEPMETDVAQFLSGLERSLADRAATVGARFAFTREALPATAFLDAEALRRAVWNLCENALRHGQGAEGFTDLRVVVRAEGDALTFEVRDHGPGVPARHRESIFEPFERLADRKRGTSLASDTGTGLGLSIVRAIARAHGGDAFYRAPDDGAGACFVLRITAELPPEDVA